MKIINTFHNTEYNTQKTGKEVLEIGKKPPWNRTESEKQFVYRVWKKLCGIKGCQCSDDLGIRNK